MIRYERSIKPRWRYVQNFEQDLFINHYYSYGSHVLGIGNNVDVIDKLNRLPVHLKVQKVIFWHNFKLDKKDIDKCKVIIYKLRKKFRYEWEWIDFRNEVLKS